jgi:hypothetical protein
MALFLGNSALGNLGKIGGMQDSRNGDQGEEYLEREMSS